MKPILFSDPMVRAILDGRKSQTRRLANGPGFPSSSPWQPGDVLWVRECWATYMDEFSRRADGEDAIVVLYRADRSALWNMYPQKHMVADFNPLRDIEDFTPRWRPSIHMPRWACRLFLDVTRVRCERLQSISEGDAIAEGWPRAVDPAIDTGGNGGPFDWFRGVWDSIYTKRPGCDWKMNPWVFVIEFEKRKEGQLTPD